MRLRVPVGHDAHAGRGAQDDSAALGLPIVLGALIAIATLVALGWRAVTKKSHSDR